MTPLVSIITASHNRAEYIADAVESVLCQGYPEVEHIIVDGASTDGTLEVLRAYRHLKVISEPDTGVYDAINKGIRAARGEIIGILNSDDCYADNILGDVVALFDHDPRIWAACGGADYIDDSGRLLRRSPGVQMNNMLHRVTRGDPCTNAWFFRKEVFSRIGYFDASYRVAADKEFLLRFSMQNLLTVPLARVVYRYRSHPGSLTLSGVQTPEMIQEELQISATYRVMPEARATIQRAAGLWERGLYMDMMTNALRTRQLGMAYELFVQAQKRHRWWFAYSIVTLPARALAYLVKQSMRAIRWKAQSENPGD